tara:strand:+ start:16381 stop:16533 length:153 start_codon:yes stop_codon:yes gene_type:complete
MIDEAEQQNHKLKFEYKTIKDQEASISKQTKEILSFIASQKKTKPDGSKH